MDLIKLTYLVSDVDHMIHVCGTCRCDDPECRMRDVGCTWREHHWQESTVPAWRVQSVQPILDLPMTHRRGWTGGSYKLGARSLVAISGAGSSEAHFCKETPEWIIGQLEWCETPVVVTPAPSVAGVTP